MVDDEKTLRNVEVESGVSQKTGKGFCPVIVTGVNGEKMVGQLSPDEVRQMALGFLAAAEAAEQDAIVFGLMREVSGDDGAGRFVAMMRSRRD